MLTRADEAIIGCYGFFLPDKGIGALIEAIGLLQARWPRIRLRLVNAEYPAPQSVEAIQEAQATVRRLGLEDAVTFETGFLSPAASMDLVRGCDLVCLPHRQSKEASSASLRSALASGVPVAVTPAAIFDEAADAVLRLAGFTPAEIADGLDGALLDHDARAASVAAAQAWSGDRSWPEIGRRWTGLLKGLAASGVTMR